MSLGEIAIIIVVAIFVCKPEDIKFMVKAFYRLKAYLQDIKQEIISPIQEEVEKIKASDLNTQEELEEMNFYLEKLTALNESYNGEYCLDSIKKYYHKLIREKHE